MDDEATRRTLLWLAEQVTEWEDIEAQFRAPCSTCGHDRSDHIVAGDADNPTPWPCIFPRSRGGPAIICYCEDYEPMREDPDDEQVRTGGARDEERAR